MNFYIRSHSTDESYTKEYMELSKICCIGYIPDYTYGDCVYFNNRIDATRENHNKFILNQEQDFYTTSLSNLTDETFTLLPKLFVDKMIKND